MSRIVDLNETGFKVDSLDSNWVKVDDRLINSKLFKSLRKGFDIDIIGRDRKGVVNKFLVSDSLGAVNEVRIPSSDNSPLFTNPKSRFYLKNLCLEIIFNSLAANNYDLGNDGNREKGIRLSHKLFVELEDAKYYKW